MASSPPKSGRELADPSAAVSPLSSLMYEFSQNVQAALDKMHTMTSEINQLAAEIDEDIESAKESVLQRKAQIEEEKDRFQKAAYAALDMLNRRGTN